MEAVNLRVKRRAEELGELVSRCRDLADKRAVIVAIAPHGRTVYRDSLANRHAHLAAMLKALSAADHIRLNMAVQPLVRLGAQGTSDDKNSPHSQRNAGRARVSGYGE